MEARTDSQGFLDENWPLGEECVAVSRRVWFRDEAGVRAVFVDNQPFHTYVIEDEVQHRFCACQLVESKLAKQGEVAKAFGLTERMLERCRRRLRDGGIEGLLPRKRGPKGRFKVSGTLARRIVRLYQSGCQKVQIAARLGLSEGTVRSVLKEHGIGPRDASAEQTQLPLALPPPAKSAAVENGSPMAATVAADIIVPGAAAVEATSIAYASPADQLATMVGRIEEAPVEFAPAGNVSLVGVLLGLALLGTTGLLDEARAVYGKLKNCWYGLRPTMLTLFAMALLRVRHPESLKGVDPASLGLVVGLPRAPEVKTVRRKLQEMSQRGLAATLHQRLAQRRAAEHEEELAYLYVDGHVRAYSGKRRIGKAYVTTRKSVQRAQTDYWVNLADGQPLLVVHAEANEKLTQMIRAILREVRGVIGQRRVMIVFDRGGWCQELFRTILAEGFDLLTYRKAPLSDWPEHRFGIHRIQIDGHEVEYELGEGDFIKKGWPRLRCVAVKRSDGEQTQILCSRYDLEPAELAYRMFGRWKQENWFKYMRENFALDVLVDYATEPDDLQRLVTNPRRRELNRQVRAAKAGLREAEAAYGRSRLSKASAKQWNHRAAAVAEAQETYQRLCRQRGDEPRQVPLKEVPSRDPIRLEYERKLLTDTIKMCAYEAETRLFEMLDETLRRNEAEGRAVVREMFQTAGDLVPRDGEVHVCLEQLSAPRYTEALMSLCRQLNERDLQLAETDFRLRFHVKPRPETRQN